MARTPSTFSQIRRIGSMILLGFPDLQKVDRRLAVRGSELKSTLDGLYATFNYPDSATDPIQIVRRFATPADREVVGFVAASLAFGRVASVLQSIERVLAIAGPRPTEYIRASDATRDAAALKALRHRWTRSAALVAL